MVPGSGSDASVPTWASSIVQHQEPHKHYFWRTTVGRPMRWSVMRNCTNSPKTVRFPTYPPLSLFPLPWGR